MVMQPRIPNSRDYNSSIIDLKNRFPTLSLLEYALSNDRTHNYRRVTALEFGPASQALRPTRRDFDSPEELSDYLKVPQSPVHSTLFLVEDLVPGYVNILGEHFKVDPTFFAGHLAPANGLISIEEGGAAPRLPSSRQQTSNDQNFWTLLFYEVLVFRDIRSLEEVDEIFRDANVYRRVHSAKTIHEFKKLGIVHSNASFWSQPRSKRINVGEGEPVLWDAIMLLDPPAIGNLVTGKYPDERTPFTGNLKPKLYQGGYADFRPLGRNFNTAAGQASLGPDRTSLFEDIIFYWTNPETPPNEILEATLDPSGTRVSRFLTQIVASNWVLLLEYLKQTICNLEYLEVRRGDGIYRGRDLEVGEQKKMKFEILGQKLADSHILRRRCAQYMEQMETNCRELGIDICTTKRGEGGKTTVKDRDIEDDFLFILERLASWQQRVVTFVGLLMSQLSILEGQRSYDEARGVTKLTVLGLVFVPLSLLAGIFSMGGDYQPGEKNFWIFFVIGIPLVAVIVLLAFCASFVKQIIKQIEWIKKPKPPAKISLPPQHRSPPYDCTTPHARAYLHRKPSRDYRRTDTELPPTPQRGSPPYDSSRPHDRRDYPGTDTEVSPTPSPYRGSSTSYAMQTETNSPRRPPLGYPWTDTKLSPTPSPYGSSRSYAQETETNSPRRPPWNSTPTQTELDHIMTSIQGPRKTGEDV